MSDDDFTKYMRAFQYGALGTHEPTSKAAAVSIAGHKAGAEARRQAAYDASEWEHSAECEADELAAESRDVA